VATASLCAATRLGGFPGDAEATLQTSRLRTGSYVFASNVLERVQLRASVYVEDVNVRFYSKLLTTSFL